MFFLYANLFKMDEMSVYVVLALFSGLVSMKVLSTLLNLLLSFIF